jgi:alpha-galactosidase
MPTSSVVHSLRKIVSYGIGLLLLLLPVKLDAQAPASLAMNTSMDWASAKLGGTSSSAFDATPPFSFVYGGKPSSDFLSSWTAKRSSKKLDANRTQIISTYTDPETGLEVRCEGIVYNDFPTVEWTVYFKNTGGKDTPILENIQAIDTTFPDQKLLHAAEGAHANSIDYRPNPTPIGDAPLSYNPGSGRGSDDVLPYFNLECGDKGGVIIAVGWPGQWKAVFEKKEHVTAGQELVHTLLHPGEEIRTPLMALQFWKDGDWIDAQNVWRRWMLAHSTPQQDGKPLPPQFNACSSHQFGEMIHADEASQKLFIDRYLEEGIKLDYWWMDAGWYVNNGTWQNVGTWEVDTKRFPNGLRAVSDHAHEKGVKIIVWFEPERVTPHTWLYDNHPEWLLGGGNGDKLLNLGNPDAWKWLTDHIDKTITDQGIDLYRQDYNIPPLGIWRASDAPDRQGMTENKYITGYLAYWDALRERHPGMFIDSCASGGRRNDLETMRRAVPLLRSDAIFVPMDQQGHTYGASFWLPYQGTGQISLDPYNFRSCMAWSQTDCIDVRDKNLDYKEAKTLFDQWRQLSPYFLADYYPLTNYSQSPGDWMAWQFNRPEKGDGIVAAFRHDKVDKDSNQFKLRGLQPDAIYTVADIDDPAKSQKLTGQQLMNDGIPVTVAAKPGAAFYTYQRGN